MKREAEEAGFATVFVLGLMVVLAAVTALVATVGALLVTRQRAASAADLTALAVAGHALEGLDAACAAGRAVADAHRVQLRECLLEDDLDAVVRVAVRAPGRLGPLGEVSVVARAGAR